MLVNGGRFESRPIVDFLAIPNYPARSIHGKFSASSDGDFEAPLLEYNLRENPDLHCESHEGGQASRSAIGDRYERCAQKFLTSAYTNMRR